VALPQVIERQEAEAEAIRRAAYDVVDETPPTSPEEGETPETPTPVPQPAPPAPPAPAPSPQPAAPVQAVPQPPVGPVGEDAAYWKQRFDTLAGKFDAEVPRLHQQLRDQAERLAALSAQVEAVPATPSSGSPALQQDIDSFGEDLVDFVRRMASEAIAAERAQLEKRFGAVTQQVEQVQGHVVRSEMSSFWKEVVSLVPDWLTIDTSPAWIQWLDSSPEYTDATYRQLAAQAIDKGKPEKIAKLVDEWRKATGYTTPSPGNGAAPQPPPPTPPPQPSLSSQVAPSTVKSGGAPVARKIISRSEYEAMYDVRNVQRYGDKEAARLIAEADAAVAEGRVQW
jgi:hypothetical protein